MVGLILIVGVSMQATLPLIKKLTVCGIKGEDRRMVREKNLPFVRLLKTLIFFVNIPLYMFGGVFYVHHWIG